MIEDVTEWHMWRNKASRPWMAGVEQAREDNDTHLANYMLKRARKAWDRAARENESKGGYSPMYELWDEDIPKDLFQKPQGGQTASP